MLRTLLEAENNYQPIEVSREDYETIKKICKKTAFVFGASIGLGISTSYTLLIRKLLVINNHPTLFFAFIPTLIITTSTFSALGAFKFDKLAEDFVNKMFVIKNEE
jgi:hypothetical protein